ncbi:MAG TPA: DegT/DnrJ/EryC1/StrS family aminotransferase, partial [Verrucomicrobiae bacterium]|nr:DegT/DnrJ/EryC1/StrS family aminotransferase [Verrucomicrobiae bacterium]
PEVGELESELARYVGARHCVTCASGTDALLMALMALGLKPGDEVITTPFTFVATAEVIVLAGARPVFVDVESDTCNIDAAKIEAAVTPRTKAIIPVHLYGQCADMAAINAIARRHKIAVIEDACQAIGAEFDGRRAGCMSDVGCFSFYPTKNLGGIGDGGLMTCISDDVAAKLRILRVHGERQRYHHQLVGFNSRLDSLQAAALNVKLPHLDRWTAQRATNAARYTELFTQAGLADCIGLPTASPRCRHVWNQYIVRVPDGKRDALREHLTTRKIGTQIYYPVPLHLQECFASLGVGPGSLPETERAAKETLALPIFPELTADEQRAVVAGVASFFGAHTSQRQAPPRPKFLDATTDSKVKPL